MLEEQRWCIIAKIFIYYRISITCIRSQSFGTPSVVLLPRGLQDPNARRHRVCLHPPRITSLPPISIRLPIPDTRLSELRILGSGFFSSDGLRFTKLVRDLHLAVHYYQNSLLRSNQPATPRIPCTSTVLLSAGESR